MKMLALGSLLVLSYAAAQVRSPQGTREPRNARLIAHIEHDGLSFSIAIDAADEKFLKIIIPEKDAAFAASRRPVVRLKVLMRNDAVIEGRADETPPWIGNGGSVDVTYRFDLGKRTVVDDIHSVTIWIGDERYTAFPF